MLKINEKNKIEMIKENTGPLASMNIHIHVHTNTYTYIHIKNKNRYLKIFEKNTSKCLSEVGRT